LILQTRDLHAYYGKSHVLHGVDLCAEQGEIVSLLGRNGVGRSTTCKAIMGLIPSRGEVLYQGRDIAGMQTHDIARLGVGYVPEDRAIFPGLTVRENLILGLKAGAVDVDRTIEEMYQIFPNLAQRSATAAGVLSGGEQQMLTICRTLMGKPDFVMIDEPTEGLAPRVVAQISEILKAIAQRGVTVLLVEQKLSISMKISDRVYVMGRGQIVFEGRPEELMAAPQIRQEWLEV
jgi:branched-chain amino acid transport system ATP-binding protein